MTARDPIPAPVANVNRDVALLRQEVRDLRRQLLNIVRYVNAHMPPHPPEALPDRRHCHDCGAPLSHHRAQAGELLLCTACGWSEFVSRDGHEYCEIHPDQVPYLPPHPSWTT